MGMSVEFRHRYRTLDHVTIHKPSIVLKGRTERAVELLRGMVTDWEANLRCVRGRPEPESRTHGDHDSRPPIYAFEEHHVAAPCMELSTAYRLVHTERDAEELAAVLMDPHREKPVVVITSAKEGPWFKPADVAEVLGADADEHLLANGGVTFDFEDAMPENASVYGGAARSYPPGNSCMRAHWKSVLRTAYTEAEARDSLASIARDIEAMAPLEYSYQLRQ
ncbi:hypothetical protein [Sinomonas sp. G460-2]|uniref:hypothetical protein n=1 Tax=Sinomonas sp. G460-2 TaxID=3393464 RepID=UPI0039EE9442